MGARSDEGRLGGTATAIRKKEEDSNAQDVTEMKANVKALNQAIQAVEKGMGDFLQTKSAKVLRTLAEGADMSTVDRDLLASFLAQKADGEDDAAYNPQSGEILGILKQLRVEIEDRMTSGIREDEASKANHESLVQAKRKEIAAATKSIQEKMGRIGDLAVEKTSLNNEIEDNKEGLEEDSRVLADLQKSCEDKKGSWATYQKQMAEEKMALAETIKLLNDDDALDVFKKTLPSPPVSFLQMQATQHGEALTVLRKGRHRSKDHRMAFLVLALQGKKVGFDEVYKMIDNLVELLRQEQTNDDNKKENCQSELNRLQDEVKAFKRTISDLDTGAASTNDDLKETSAQIEAMMAGIRELDKQVAVATEARKQEHAETVEVLAENNAAKSLLELAKNRLHKMYNPKLHNAAGAAALAQSPKIEEGPDLTYRKQGQEAGGVIGMIDMLRADLLKQNTAIETAEKLAQEDYQTFIQNSADKRAMDSKAITDKENVKAEHEVTLHQMKTDKKVQQEQLASTEKELLLLHKDCDWLLQKYSLRKEARVDEIDSLQKAKAVLSGASDS